MDGHIWYVSFFIRDQMHLMAFREPLHPLDHMDRGGITDNTDFHIRPSNYVATLTGENINLLSDRHYDKAY
jgi:hypothetical protein